MATLVHQSKKTVNIFDYLAKARPQKSYYSQIISQGPKSTKSGAPSSTRPGNAIYKWMVDGRNEANSKFSPHSFKRSRLPSKSVLRPAAISERIHSLCNDNKLEEALDLVKMTPIYSQNTVVWNTLLTKVFDSKKYELAYQLFTDMKRRGHKPSTATFITMLSRYGRIEDWEKHSKQLQHCHTLYAHYLKHVEQIKATDTRGKESLVGAAVLYMKILSMAGLYQKMFDVFNNLDEVGPMSPDGRVFSMLLHALNHRKSSDKEDGLPIEAQNASDGKMLWRRMEGLAKKNSFPIDHELLGAGLRLLSKGRPSDREFAFDIIRRYVGLMTPEEGGSRPSKVISPSIAQAVLDLCDTSDKHNLCIQYGQDLLKGGFDVDCKNMEVVLHAHLALAAPGGSTESEKALDLIQMMLRSKAVKLQPQNSTYSLAIMICNREKNWDTAMKVVELMTGYPSETFLREDEKESSVLDQDEKPSSRLDSLDPRSMLYLIRTASSQQDIAKMQQCLRVVQVFGIRSHFLDQKQDQSHVTSKLASELLQLTTAVHPFTKSNVDLRNWSVIKRAAEGYRKHFKSRSNVASRFEIDQPGIMEEAVKFRSTII